MIDLKGNPFYLSDEDIQWVETTLAGMTVEEKAGQLFCPICMSSDESFLQHELIDRHIGGLLFKTSPSAEVRAAQQYMHVNSKIPVICAANLEFGSTGYLQDGTLFGQQMAIGATGDTEQAYRMSYVSCKEAAAVGCNVAFAPVSDLDLNWRNPIINVRSYGKDPDTVLAMCKAYQKGANENGIAVSVKHFPGDGVDEVDQHLLVSINSLSAEEWDAAYGKVYRGMIENGARTIMIGHIDQPAWRRRINPELPEGTVPATLSPELMQGLLREHLGFNGVIFTDATVMVGFTSAMEREKAVPYSIEAGADIFLFNKHLGEDYEFMLQGIENGILSRKRLDEAVARILALKASLGLNKKPADQIIPPPEAMACIGCAQHHEWAAELADKAVTLVKDTAGNLPMSAAKTPRLLLEVMGGYPSDERVGSYMKRKLEAEGFDVTIYKPEEFGSYEFGVRPFKDRFDGVLYLANVENVSNKTTNRLNWNTFWGHGDNVPWFNSEVPTIFASVGNPYHLVDVPMIHTFVNCYTNNAETLDALTEKLMGRSEFKGMAPTDPFLGKEWLKY